MQLRYRTFRGSMDSTHDSIRFTKRCIWCELSRGHSLSLALACSCAICLHAVFLSLSLSLCLSLSPSLSFSCSRPLYLTCRLSLVRALSLSCPLLSTSTKSTNNSLSVLFHDYMCACFWCTLILHKSLRNVVCPD